MSAALQIPQGVGRDWTAADFDSLTVLIELGVPNPVARVSSARQGRPLRRAFRAALRTATAIDLTSITIREEAVGR